MSTSLALVMTVLLLAGNAFFVGAEFAVTSARRSQLEPLAEEGDTRARTALWALENVSRMLATAQLGVTLCSTGLGVVAEPAIAHALQPWVERAGLGAATAHVIAVIIALVIVVYVHVVAGEMVPKNLSIAAPDTAVRWLAPPLVWVSRAFGPVITVLNGFANWILGLLGIEARDEVAAAFSVEEVASIVERSTAEGVLDDESGLLSGALEFSNETAASAMVGLDQLVSLPAGCSPEDVERAVTETGFSRFPVRLPDDDAASQMPESGAASLRSAQGGAGVTGASVAPAGRASGEAPGAAAGTDLAASAASRPLFSGYLHLKDVLYAATAEQRSAPVDAWRARALVSVRAEAEIEEALELMQRSGAHLGQVEDEHGRVLGVLFLEDILEELVGEVRDSMQRASHGRPSATSHAEQVG